MNIYSLLLAFTVGMTCLIHGISFVVVPSSSLRLSQDVHWWASLVTATTTLPLNVGSFFTLYVLRSELASKKELTSLAEKVDSLEGKVDLIYDLLIKKEKELVSTNSIFLFLQNA